MELTNAIAKARFATAKAQRVRLHRGRSLKTELLCLESGQELSGTSGEWVYYVISGKAKIAGAGDDGCELTTGHAANIGPDTPHSIVNVGEQRLLCLAVGRAR
jgi:mannose-6-phosphate isomerase-like protein (cupin superfamily)